MRTYAATVTKEEEKIAKFKGKKGSDVQIFRLILPELQPLCSNRGLTGLNYRGNIPLH